MIAYQQRAARQARRDIRYSPQGIAKALQMDVAPAALVDAVDACTLCGACEPACPEVLPLVELTLDLRRRLAGDNSGPDGARLVRVSRLRLAPLAEKAKCSRF